MDLTTLAAIGTIALVIVVLVVVMLRRSWGSSLDRTPTAWTGETPTPSVRYNSAADIPGQELGAIRALVAQGHKIEAIKQMRELTGLGLKEAKDAVEALAAGMPVDLSPIDPQAGYEDSSAQTMEEVHALIAQGNKIEAIKRVRELTGLGLKEAKDYVEAIPPYGAPPPLPNLKAAQGAREANLAEVHALARQGQKIQAIKLYRELTGVGLKEAKDYVDSLL